ncbi:MAG: hypothetical protein LBU70_08870, partial [Chitinispirillales bacterium]|nr:hypothetical protein [Chitinispirillales bacterium]
VHIFKEKPRLIPAFPNDPENLRYVAQLEEEMSYYVYMYKLPDRTLIIYDEHFNPSIEENGVRTGTNLQFNLSGNLNTQQQAATLHAINLWSAELAGVVPVDIKVEFVSLPSGTLGRSRQQPHYLKSGDSTWYSSALGNQIANYKVSNLSDIKLEMSSNFSWNYSITSPPSGNQYDWLTVMLHEITHGLGFASLIYWDNTLQNNGRYVYTVNDTLAAYTNYPGIFDRQLFQGTSGPNLTSLNQSQRAALVVSNNLFSGRPSSHLLAANGGARVKMYAPFSWRSGSSVSHWDWDNSATPTLMKPFLDPGFRHAVIDAREVAIMQDMGWAVCRPIVNFTNQTVTTNMTVANGCGVVNVQNTTVTPTGTLNIRAERVTIGPGFTVQSGNLTIRVP